MTAMLEMFASFFEEDGWPHTHVDEMDALQTRFRGDNGEWTCVARAREEMQQVLFYSVCSVQVPEPQRLTVAELLTRANYGLSIGNFELDFNDGEIRYKTSIDVEDDQLTLALIKNIVYANVSTMNSYMPAIMAVLYGKVSPAQAIVEAEAEDEDADE